MNREDRRVISFQFSVLSLTSSGSASDFADKCGEHSLKFYSTCFEEFVIRFADKLKVTGQQEMVFELTRGTHGDLQEAGEFCLPFPAACFGNVGGNGCARSPNLTGEAIELRLWEGSGCFVNRQSQLMTLLPHLERSEVLHGCSLLGPMTQAR